MCTSARRLKAHFQYSFVGMMFLALFGAVYETFSHGVCSYFMIYAFAVPLLLGVLPYAILLAKEKYPPDAFLRLWSAGTAVYSVGSVFAGVLAIYGTSNRLIIVYPVAGSLLLLAALISLAVGSRGKKTSAATEP